MLFLVSEKLDGKCNSDLDLTVKNDDLILEVFFVIFELKIVYKQPHEQNAEYGWVYERVNRPHYPVLDKENGNDISKCTADALSVNHTDERNVWAIVSTRQERNIDAKNDEARDREPNLQSHVCAILVDLLEECSDYENKEQQPVDRAAQVKRVWNCVACQHLIVGSTNQIWHGFEGAAELVEQNQEANLSPLLDLEEFLAEVLGLVG